MIASTLFIFARNSKHSNRALSVPVNGFDFQLPTYQIAHLPNPLGLLPSFPLVAGQHLLGLLGGDWHSRSANGAKDPGRQCSSEERGNDKQPQLFERPTARKHRRSNAAGGIEGPVGNGYAGQNDDLKDESDGDSSKARWRAVVGSTQHRDHQQHGQKRFCGKARSQAVEVGAAGQVRAKTIASRR